MFDHLQPLNGSQIILCKHCREKARPTEVCHKEACPTEVCLKEVCLYALLHKDYEVLSRLAPGVKPPEPMLYDAELHKRHRTGQYQSLKEKQKVSPLVESSPAVLL